MIAMAAFEKTADEFGIVWISWNIQSTEVNVYQQVKQIQGHNIIY